MAIFTTIGVSFVFLWLAGFVKANTGWDVQFVAGFVAAIIVGKLLSDYYG